MNNQEILAEIETLKGKISSLENYVKQRSSQQISYPVDNASRIAIGVGFTGLTTDTVAVGAMIVNTNNGPMKILYAA